MPAKRARYDPERLCDNCGESIPKIRQENAIKAGRIPTYCSDQCSNRAAQRRHYATKGRAKRLLAKALVKAKREQREAQARAAALLLKVSALEQQAASNA